MADSWICGDCRTRYPMNVTRCWKAYDDYLALRGGTVASAILRAATRATDPMVARAMRRLSGSTPPPRQRIRMRLVPWTR